MCLLGRLVHLQFVDVKKVQDPRGKQPRELSLFFPSSPASTKEKSRVSTTHHNSGFTTPSDSMGRTKNPKPTKRPRIIVDWHSTRRAEGKGTTEVIEAPSDDPVVAKIREFEELMRTEVFQEIKSLYEKEGNFNWYQGIRLINGGRYEVRLLGEFMQSRFGSLTKELLAYAIRQARRDERVTDAWIFTEWTLIISDFCEAQTVHVDVGSTNVQFGLVFQDGIPGTKVVSQENLGPYTVEGILELKRWQSAPASVKKALKEREPYVLKLLDAYGPLLRDRKVLQQHMKGAEEVTKNSKLCAGDLMCTSGGIPHAGPSCDRFRMVLFGSASPVREAAYDLDEQYFALSIILFMTRALWDHCDAEGRIWMLMRIPPVLQEYSDTPLVANHDFSVNEDLFHWMRRVERSAALGVNPGFSSSARSFVVTNQNVSSKDLFPFEPKIPQF